MTDREDPMLDAALAALRDRPPEVSPALLARVLADAGTVRPRAERPRRMSASGWLRIAAAAVGGMRGLGGLATAAVAGLWIGISPPAPIAALEAALLGTPIVMEFDADPGLDMED